MTTFVHWQFIDPLGSMAPYTFPINPNHMTDPVLKKATTTFGVAPIGGTSRGWRSNRLAPRDWTFGGVTRTQAEQDHFLAWFELDQKIHIRDHFGRVWLARLVKFSPEPRPSTKRNNFRFNYTFDARVYQRIS